MSNDRQFIDNLCDIFVSREVITCFDASEQENFQVCEDEQTRRVCIIDITQSKLGFRIYNPREKVIHVFATDNCFFRSHDGKRCDCTIDPTISKEVGQRTNRERKRIDALCVYNK